MKHSMIVATKHMMYLLLYAALEYLALSFSLLS